MDEGNVENTLGDLYGSASIVLPGIGRSVLVKRQARIGRNPTAGDTIKIPAKTVVKIRPAKALKEATIPSKE